MAVDVGVAALIGSYATLRNDSAKTEGAPAHLLLCYAVECGLKAAYLRRGKSRSTDALPPELRNHDLRELGKALNLASTHLEQIKPCRRRHASQIPVEPRELHEAWRYGAALDNDDEQRAVTAIQKLSEWCRRELNQ